MLVMFEALMALLEPLLSVLFGPRHEPPRTDTRVLGDISSPRHDPRPQSD